MRAMSIVTSLIPTCTIFVFALGLVGCEKNGGAEQSPGRALTAPATSQSAEHAPTGVQPGSHEDWCGAHAVPESLCTRCNPSLIAAFEATGDWCGEHGLPESQCLICNPDLKIERPPKAAGTQP